MSAAENEKENKKKEKQSKMKSSYNSVGGSSMMGPVAGGEVTKRYPTAEGIFLKKMRSPKTQKVKKNASREGTNSDLNTDIIENPSETDEEKTVSYAGPVSESHDLGSSKMLNPSQEPVASRKITAPPIPPPTHFLPVIIEVNVENWDLFARLVKKNEEKPDDYNELVNLNMVIKTVPLQMMSDFMPGDQIALVNENGVWNIEDFRVYLSQTLDGLITVIRPWNIQCLTKDQLVQVSVDQRRHYFMVQIYGKPEKKIGIKLGRKRKRIIVERVWAGTPSSQGLLAGDQILGISNEMLTGKSSKKKALKMMKANFAKFGFVEILASRPIGARSSPAPSLEAEQVNQYPAFADNGEKIKKKDEEKLQNQINLPLPADALEIAFRELTFLQMMGLPDSEEFSRHRGPSLFELRGSANNSSKALSSARLPSTTESIAKAPSPKNSSREPPTKSKIQSPKPSKHKLVKKLSKEEKETKPIEEHEETKEPKEPHGSREHLHPKFADAEKLFRTDNITSDIPEGESLRKCDGKSGMVAFIKSKFNSKPGYLGPPPPPPPGHK